MSGRRSGRRESRPGDGPPSSHDRAKYNLLRRLGSLANTTLGDQLEFNYEASLKFTPHIRDQGYMPTPEEIKAKCKSIRKGWSKQKWRHVLGVKPVEIVDYQTRDLG